MPATRARGFVVGLVSAWLCLPITLGAQFAVAREDVYLRPNHSTSSPPIRAILGGDTVEVLEADTTNGFIHVRAPKDSARGWVYSRYVAIVGASRPPARPLVPIAPASFHGCPNEGMTRSGKTPAPPMQALNLLKNRFTAPTPADLDSRATLDALLAPGDDTGRFDEKRGAVIVGFVTDVQVGGEETTNCDAVSLVYRDTHIRIALSAGAPENQRVVVEVTPRWREAMQAAGVDWSTPGLARALVGRSVRVRGWLLFDSEHAKQSENTNPGGSNNWRATAWEIHPVTALEVLPP
jgi:hypothetical protein